MTAIQIDPEMTMEQILRVAPAAQRALFRRYHVGGCSSCGFQPSDTLAQVAKDHNILDVSDMVDTILRAQELDAKLQVSAQEVQTWLEAGEDFSFIDVRNADEIETSRVASAEPFDYSDSERYMSLDKARKIVFLCRDGDRSLDVASYFAGHGFTAARAVRGGTLAWSDEVDPSVPKY